MSTARRSTRPGESAPPSEHARERILLTAYDLFARNGIRAVGVDRIVAESGVAKTTLYRHFASKDDLVVAALESVIEYEPQPDERNLVAFPSCHVAGYTVPVTQFRGGHIVLTPMFEPELWMKLVDQHGITATALATHTYLEPRTAARNATRAAAIAATAQASGET